MRNSQNFIPKGSNYLGGNIVNLKIGNTEVVASKIKSFIGGDLFKTDTINPYPIDYNETTEVAKVELGQNARPELAYSIKNIDDYGVIYLGYPNWWGTFPMAVFTFLESYDFSGKTIVPFCTHEGSGLGHSEGDIKKLCPNAKVLPSIAIREGLVANSDSLVLSWLRKSDEFSYD